MTEEENDKRLKDSLKLIDEYFEKNKKPTLKQKFIDFIYNHQDKEDYPKSYEDYLSSCLVEIVSDWLPKEHPTNDYKWNQCVRTIRENLK